MSENDASDDDDENDDLNQVADESGLDNCGGAVVAGASDDQKQNNSAVGTNSLPDLDMHKI